jgi:signal transduction histidine kinase
MSKPSPLSYIIYKKLPDGQYTLHIRPVLNGRPLKETSLSFEILTPYWKEWWFIISCAILFFVLSYLIVTIRLRRIKSLAKRLSNMVDKRTSQLNKQNEQLKEYTYAISHDLKNPVLNIEGLSNILVDEELPQDEKRQIHIMLKETSGQLHQNLLGLIEVLKSGGLTSVEEVNIKDIMREIEIENNSAFLNKEVQVNYDIKQEHFLFNKENLKSVLANLVSNAIKYSHPDRKPEISFNSFQKGEYNYLEVEDNGLGIDMEKDGDKLFGMFRRIHTNAEGSGVGMYMVNTIIQKAGGEIDVESELGIGTKFIVKIPVKPETLD